MTMNNDNKILGCNASRLCMISFAWNIILILMLYSNSDHFNYTQTLSNNILRDNTDNKTNQQTCKNITKIVYIPVDENNNKSLEQQTDINTNINQLKNKPNKQQNDFQWYYDLIPINIRNKFPITFSTPPTRGEFNITETMLRQTRPIVGNTLRLHKILKSVIYSNECMKIITIGSSVTGGTNAGGIAHAYSVPFNIWLNEKYPNCHSNVYNISQHEVTPYVAGGTNIMKIVENFEALMEFTNDMKVDIIIIEYNVNDNFMHLAHDTGVLNKLSNDEQIDPQKSDMDSKSKTVNWYSELLIRRILSVNNHTALLFFDASFMDFYRHFARGNKDGKQVQWIRYPILSYYAIPTISAVVPLFNLYQFCKNNNSFPLDWKQNRIGFATWFHEDNMYSWWQIFTDPCCHPFRFGHNYMALTLAYNFDKEVNWIKYHDSRLNYYEIQRNLFMPPLWRVTQQEYNMFTAKHITRIDIGKHEPVENVEYFNNNGFEWKSDTVKQKYGLIATEFMSHITFKIETKIGLVTIGYLTTYKKI
eukprot:174266_1